MTLAGLFKRKPKPKKDPEHQDIKSVLEDVRNHAADLRRNSNEIDQWLTSLKGHHQ